MTHLQLRGKIAETGRPLYEVAARIPCHPTVLGQVLKGRRPLTAEFEEQALRAVASMALDGTTAA